MNNSEHLLSMLNLLHTRVQTFVKVIALLMVACGDSSQICCFYNVNKHVGYDMTSTVMSFAQ